MIIHVPRINVQTRRQSSMAKKVNVRFSKIILNISKTNLLILKIILYVSQIILIHFCRKKPLVPRPNL